MNLETAIHQAGGALQLLRNIDFPPYSFPIEPESTCHQGFLAFLKQVARAYPDDGNGQQLHLIMDNYAAHKRPEIRRWLQANPRIHVHFTPTSAS